MLQEDGNSLKASKKGKKQKKKKLSNSSKSGMSEADWTWKDQVDMVKWTDKMIQVIKCVCPVALMAMGTILAFLSSFGISLTKGGPFLEGFYFLTWLFRVSELLAATGALRYQQDGPGVLRLHHAIHG